MIEPYVSEKQCVRCMQCKPIDQFKLRKGRADRMARFSYCSDCQKAYSLEYYHQHKSPKAVVKKVENPTAWLLPSDPRDFRQKLLAATQRRWAYQVEPTQNLVPILKVAA